MTAHEIRTELFTRFDDLDVRVLGTDVPNVLNALGNELGTRVMAKASVAALVRRWGWSLWTSGRKHAS